MAYGSILLEPDTTTVDAELTGFEQVIGAVIALARTGHILFLHDRVVDM